MTDTTKKAQVKITEATEDQLRVFALQLGLEVADAGKDALPGLLKKAGYMRDTIPVIEEAPSAERPAHTPDTLERSEVCVWDGSDEFGIKRARRMVYIQIPNQDKPGGEHPVCVGINGSRIDILRNTPSLVPEEYVESLDHAIETKYDPSSDPLHALSRPRFVQRYPVQRVAIPDDSVLRDPRGRPYQKATEKDVKAYKEKRMAKEMELAQKDRQRLRDQGLVA